MCSIGVETRKICQLCGKKFYAGKGNVKYCSEECSKEAYRIKSREWLREKRLTDQEWHEAEKRRNRERYRKKRLTDPEWYEEKKRRNREQQREKRLIDHEWYDELKRKERERYHARKNRNLQNPAQ